jgi:hypothetical protein
MNVNPNNKECMKIGSQKYPKEDGALLHVSHWFERIIILCSMCCLGLNALFCFDDNDDYSRFLEEN